MGIPADEATENVQRHTVLGQDSKKEEHKRYSLLCLLNKLYNQYISRLIVPLAVQPHINQVQEELHGRAFDRPKQQSVLPRR